MPTDIPCYQWWHFYLPEQVDWGADRRWFSKTGPLRYSKCFSTCLRGRDTSWLSRKVLEANQNEDDGNFLESLYFIVELRSWCAAERWIYLITLASGHLQDLGLCSLKVGLVTRHPYKIFPATVHGLHVMPRARVDVPLVKHLKFWLLGE